MKPQKFRQTHQKMACGSDDEARRTYEKPEHLIYKKPQVYFIDTAMHLMQQNISGQLRDGSEGWYVWGS